MIFAGYLLPVFFFKLIRIWDVELLQIQTDPEALVIKHFENFDEWGNNGPSTTFSMTDHELSFVKKKN